MKIIRDENALVIALKKIDTEIDKLNDQKIKTFIEFLGLHEREDVPENYLDWENILIVVPDRHVSNEIKKYKHTISGITFLTNPNAQRIHLFDLKQWKQISQNKNQFQIRQLLRTNFGGVKDNGNSSPEV